MTMPFSLSRILKKLARRENTKKIEIRENDIFSDLIGFISESSGSYNF